MNSFYDKILDTNSFRKSKVDQLKKNFSKNKYIVIKDLLNKARLKKLEELFPDNLWPYWEDNSHCLQLKQYSSINPKNFHPIFKSLIYQLQKADFIRFLMEITNEKVLIPDPFLDSAGMHLCLQGGTLTPHSDFEYSEKNGMRRVLTIVFYFNKKDNEVDYGQLKIFKNGAEIDTIPTESGTSLIMATKKGLVHGITTEVSASMRKSFVYFYYAPVITMFPKRKMAYYRPNLIQKTWLRTTSTFLFGLSYFFYYLYIKTNLMAKELSKRFDNKIKK